MITQCKYCNANIMFVKMVSGKSMPVDFKPIKKIVKDPDEHVYAICDCYTSHFETCPYGGDGSLRPIISSTATFNDTQRED